MEILFLIIGIIVGGSIAWFGAKSKFSAQLASRETELLGLKSRYLEEQSKDQKFEDLAKKILAETSKGLIQDNKINLQDTLNPLKEKISEFQNQAQTIHKENIKETTSLKEQISLFSKLNEQMSKDATNLTNAIKGETKTQGGWGEMILESILEKSGLVKNLHFNVQESLTDSDGKRLQPDVIINLPGKKQVVVDSKVSLVAYEKFWSNEDENIKETYLREHINSIRNHIKGLSKKNYQSLYQINTLDFVLMFIPVEPAYLIALNKDLELWNFAYEQNVILLGPTNLIPTLRLINNLWKMENQNVNALEIARQSGDLYDKFVNLVEDLLGVGKQMDGAKTSYEKAMIKMSTGKGNLLNRIETIKKLGARSTKTLPPGLLDRAKEK